MPVVELARDGLRETLVVAPGPGDTVYSLVLVLVDVLLAVLVVDGLSVNVLTSGTHTRVAVSPAVPLGQDSTAMVPDRKYGATQDAHSLLVGPVHVPHSDAQPMHVWVPASKYWPSGHTLQVLPDKTYPATHEVHCALLGPPHVEHPTAHAAHCRVETFP